MNSELKAFVDAERKRVAAHDPHFAGRVLSRLRAAQRDAPSTRPASIWDIVPGAARPTFALAALLILAFLAIQSAVPAIPGGSAGAEEYLFVDAEMLTTDEALAELIMPEGGL